jgi:hypothetical protein
MQCFEGFFLFHNLFAICIDTLKYNQQMMCWEARAGRGGVPCMGCEVKFHAFYSPALEGSW